MTDRERLEEIINRFYICGSKHCEQSRGCATCEYNKNDDYCLNKMLVDKLIENGVTFKKKREYIRKSPCKCGANNRNAELNLEFGRFYYKCKKCKSRSFPCKTREEALIEWNKMNEVK